MRKLSTALCWYTSLLGCLACGSDAEQCSDSDCSVGPLSASHYCSDSGQDCGNLASHSQGCIGSHTEVTCEACAGTFVRVGGDDAADLYFDSEGKLAAVRRVDEGTATCAAWFGLDLSDCVNQGKPVQVPCDGNGNDGP